MMIIMVMGIQGNGSGSARRYAIGIQQRLYVDPPPDGFLYTTSDNFAGTISCT